MPRAVLSSSASPTPKVDVLIDSGAYSAWRLGSPINLDEYCDFLLANREWIWEAVSLDVINPGNPEGAAKQGRENYLHMRSRGLKPIPVFHVGEDIGWLYRMLDDGATYIGLSASSIVSRAAVDEWYEMAWNALVDSDGLPIVKAHAFGEGRESSLRKFPWYSADSASWIYAAQRTGIIHMESGDKLACRKDGQGTDAAPDVNSLDDMTQEWFNGEMDRLGIDKDAFLERGHAAYVVSTYCAALYYIGLQMRINRLCPIHHHPQGFFVPAVRDAPAIDIPNMRMFLVSGSNPTCFGVLAKAQHRNMLSSYFHIKGKQGGKNKGAAGHYRALQEFVYDPIKAVSQDGPIKRYYDILSQYVK
jgi:hypothetical protein